MKPNFDSHWRDAPVPGYKVSDRGEIWSFRSRKFLSPYKSKKGYLQVHIGGKIWYVSHLVWYCFKGFKPTKMRYADGNNGNCSLENLINISSSIGDVNLEEDQ